ncbi:MAG: chemotaxis protein CheA [Marinilabilia sp.]
MAFLDKFQDKFRDEAFDNISEMEQVLLDLELSPRDHELREKMYRALHSLKGGGTMFGFDLLSELAHKIEDVFDRIRSRQLAVSPELLTMTFKAVDLFKEILNTDSPDSPELLEKSQVIEADFAELVQKEIGPCSDTSISRNETGIEEKGMGTYYIHFFPATDTLKNGTNLLYLIEDLKELGNLFAVSRLDSVPSFHDLDPVNCYVYWDLFVSTDQGESSIRDVFIFVEEESSLEINKISDADLFSSPGFTEKLDELFREKNRGVNLSEIKNIAGHAEQMISGNDAGANEQSNRTEKRNPSDETNSNNRNHSSIRVPSEKIDNLMDLVSEMVIAQEKLNMIASRHSVPELKQTVDSVKKLTSQLRDSTFSISLVPVESLLTRFQRHVRDLSEEMGKSVLFKATGTETELDKTLIESLTDPLLHLIRNSIDHGIELPRDREQKGKPSEGTITLDAFYSGANVIIEISDDGAGMDPDVIREKAVRKGIIQPESQLSKEEILKLVFLPGFSTSDEVTEVSGRGVGMDVVNNAISAIRGDVKISSAIDQGTTITIVLPLVLSVLDGLLVQVDEARYVLPLSLIGHIYFVESQVLNRSFNNTVSLGGKLLPFIDLRKEFSIYTSLPPKRQMVVVDYEGNQVAIAVDRVLGKIQAVLKPLGKFFSGNKIISAATIMGDGSVGLMLDIHALINHSSEGISKLK